MKKISRILLIGVADDLYADFYKRYEINHFANRDARSDLATEQLFVDQSNSIAAGLQKISQSIAENAAYEVVIINAGVIKSKADLAILIQAFQSNSQLHFIILPVNQFNQPIPQLIGTLDISKTFQNSLFAAVEGQANAVLEGSNKNEDAAYYDLLTGLPNRHYFKEMLSRITHQQEREGQQVGLFFIDVDDFRKINDTYGHAIGDELIEKIAKRLGGILRKNDFVARSGVKLIDFSTSAFYLGGDNFAVILTHFKNVANLRKIAKRIVAQISESWYQLHNIELKINVSIGISIFPNDAKNSDTFIRNAEIAMHEAKNSGKNKYIFNDKVLNEAIVRKNTLEQDAIRAIEKNEFFLMFQPKLCLKTKKIAGCEALLRWEHQKYGNIEPSEFIPIAEETSLIIKIDEWVLKEVCKAICFLKRLNLMETVRISMNVSSRFLSEPTIAKSMQEIIDKNDIYPENLEIEITESHLVQCNLEMVNRMNELRSMGGEGIKISIDDFGVGYSSLDYLCKFPINTIKIDLSFMQRIFEEKNKKIIIKTIIDLCHQLSMNVVSEGVETAQQYHLLREYGCDQVQGFLIAKPMAITDLVRFFKEWNTISFEENLKKLGID